MREREDASRTREAGNRDEIEGVVANTLNLLCQGAVGFIGWLGSFDAKLEVFPSFSVERQLDRVISFRIARSNL